MPQIGYEVSTPGFEPGTSPITTKQGVDNKKLLI
jgi:hypothetical protein